jgi:hypothetical protein
LPLRNGIDSALLGRSKGEIHRSDLLRTSALALAFVGSVGLAVAQQAPAQNNALVNGALAVPGAPANTETVPAKFSAKNAADDKLNRCLHLQDAHG